MDSPRQGGTVTRRADSHRRSRGFAFALGFLLACSLGPACAAPQGGRVVAGKGGIERPNDRTLIVHQNSESLVADWKSFNIAPGEQVRFDQPDAQSAALNRILDQNPSRILGSLNANGRIFLSNPNGLVFGKSATVNVSSLVATTLSIDNRSFMSGHYRFDYGGPGAIDNKGVLTAVDGGSISLIGDSVSNEGLIIARLGRVNLASGGSATIDFYGDNLVHFEVGDGGPASALRRATNSGRIQADGGRVLMTAAAANALVTSVVNNDGMIRANSVVKHDGRIELVGDGQVVNGGVLDVSGRSAGTTGGEVDVTGRDILIRTGSRTDASGADGGGAIHIGGSYRGQGPLKNAQDTTVESDSVVRADALEHGDGGQVVIWSKDSTRIDGRISARGGSHGGNGGSVETSSGKVLDFTVPVDVSAPAGEAGTWLLDPEDIVIDGGKAGSIESALNDGSNVSIQTSSDGEGDGNITVASSIDKTAGGDASLTLDAYNRIDVNAPITSTSGKLDVALLAGSDINVNSAIDTNSGNFSATITGLSSDASSSDTSTGGGSTGDVSSTDTATSGTSSADGSQDVSSTDTSSESATSTDAATSSDTSAGDASTIPNTTVADGSGTSDASVDGTTQGSGELLSGGQADSGSSDAAVTDASSSGSADTTSNDTASSNVSRDGTMSTDGVDATVEVVDGATASTTDSGGDATGIGITGSVTGKGADILLDAKDEATRVSGMLDASNDSGQGGTIRLLGGDVSLEGAMVDASGSDGGGQVLIGTDVQGQPSSSTGTRVDIDQQTSIRADGGATGNGGRISVWSRESTIDRGAIAARGGSDAGDGGSVEVSSSGQVTLGGSFDVAAPHGSNGSVLIDPAELHINVDQISPGANITLAADNLVEIASGVVVSTRDIGSGTDQVHDVSVGDSGSLTVQSTQIDIRSGAKLLTFADSGYASGDILLQTQAANDPSATTADGVAASSSRIRINSALVHGGKVDITSTAQTVVNYDDATTYSSGGRYADVTNRLGARLGQSFGTKKVYGGVSVAHASSTINIKHADITADGALSVLADANASATVQTKSNALSLAYGETSANASINVHKSSSLSAGDGITLHATTVNATTVATNARKTQVRRPSSSSTGGALVTLAVSDTNASSSATVDNSSSIDAGGAAAIQADSDKAVATFSAANAFRNGTLGQSTALSFSDIHTNARVDGRIHADSLDVTATTHALASHTGALAGFKGTASSKQKYQNVSGQLNAFFVDQTLQHALGMSLSSTLPAASSLFSSAYGNLSSAFQNQFGASLPSGSNLTSQVVNPVTGQIQNRLYRALIFELPGSEVFTDHGNDTNAVIGSPAVVKVDHDINVKATILDEHLQNFSHSDVQLNRSGTTRPSQSALTSVAVMATIHDNSANALIESGAVVDAGGALAIDANIDVPNDGFNWPDTSAVDNAVAKLGAINTSLTDLSSTGSQLGGIFDDFKDDLRDEGDVLAGLVTTSAKARAGTSSRKFPADYQIGIAGSANLLSIDNSALARIGDGAAINQDPNYRGAGQDVTVTAHASIDTVNLSGNIGVIPPPSGTGTSGGTDSHKGDFLGVDKSSRDTTGAGSSYLGLRFANNAIAEIGDAVALHADALSVHGTTEMSNVSASVASGTGERYGLKGSYAGTDAQGDTQAKIDDGASVDASSVDLNASSGTPRNFNVAVGEINDRSTKTSGGTRPDDRWAAAVVDNHLQRNVQAFIGNRTGEPAGAGNVNAGIITLNAGNTGSIEGYSLAVDRTSGSGSSGSRTAQQMNYNGRRGIRGGRGTHFGIRASIDVSRNRIEDATRAYIDGGATITASGPLTLTSRSSDSISAFAGAATLMSDSSGTNSQRGIAGAYSENTIGEATQAFLAQVPYVTASSILLDAASTPTISGIAAGGAKSNQTDAIVGSVVNNSIDNAPDINGTRPASSPYGARAYVRDTTVQSTGNVTLTATDSPTIDAIAGALAKSNAGGYGGAFALNAVGGDAEATIDNSAVNPLGILSLDAANDAGIDATAGALGKGENDAFAGALSWNDIANTTLANIVDGKASGLSVTADAISIQATDLAGIDTFAGALGNSKNRAIGAAASVNRMADETLAGIDNALVSAPVVTVHADTGTSADQNTINTRVAGLSSSGGDTIAVAVAVNDIGNQTKAYVTGGAEIRDGASIPVNQLDIAAKTDSAIDLLSVSLSNSNSSSSGTTSRVNSNPGQYLIPGSNTAFGIDISADIAFNTISDDTLAYVDRGSVVDITGPVSLTAHANSDIETTTGAIQRTTRNTGTSGDVFGVAGVLSKNELGGETAAYIDNADVSTGGALDIAASRGGSVQAIAAGWKSGSKVGLAGAVTYNDVHTVTRAGLYDSANVHSGGAARVTANDAVDLFSLAGGLMLDGQQGGVGAGIAINDIARTTSALVDDTALTGSGLTLIASAGGEVNAWAISLEKAPIGLAGSLTYNRFNDRTQAGVSNGRSDGRHVTEHGIVSVNALDDVNAFSLAGAGAIAKAQGRSGAPFTAAVGVAVAYNEVGDGNLTTAAITDAVLSTDPAPASGESIALWANRDGTFEADAISGAVSGDLSIAGSGVINNLAGTTEALIDNAVVLAGGSLSVKADSLLDVVSHAPAVSLQSKEFGFGGAATVNLLDSATLARIIDSTGAADGATTVDALGGGAPVYTYTGELDGSGNRLTAPVNGLAVVSSASTRIENLAATLSNSRNLALGAAVSVNLVNDASSAKIGTGAEVNQSAGTPAAGQAVVVRAANHTSIDSTDGGLASAQTGAAVGAAVDVSLFNKTTSALVDHARVDAQNQVVVDARSSEALTVVAIGGALTDAPVGIAGSLSVAEFDSNTTSGISGGRVTTPGDLGVYATDSLSPDLTVGGVQVGDGLLGVAGSLVYVRTAGLTDATIGGGAQTDAGGLTAVDARTVQNVKTTALAGKAGGDIAIVGAVAVKVLDASTLAGIGQGAYVNQDPTLTSASQDVGVESASDLYVNGLATGVEIGGEIGVGGALDVNLVNDNAAANIEDAAADVLVSAGRDITVSADSHKDIGSVAVAGSAGGGVSVAGAVAITSISSTVNQDMADAITELNALGSGSGSPLAGPSVPGTPTVNNRTSNAVNGIQPVGTALQAGAPLPPSGTSARVGVHARLDAGRDIRVGASLGSDNDLVAGDISLVNDASIGAGVSFLYSRDTTDAVISGAPQVDAGGSVYVNALEQAVNSRSTAPLDNAHSSVAAFSGSVGSNGFGGGVVYIDKADTTRAHIEDMSAPVNAFGGSIDVTADNQGAIDATAAGVAIEGGQAAGGVIIADLGNVTEAFAVRSTLRADDNLLLQANEDNEISVVDGNFNLPSGVAVGGAVSTLISENQTSAYLDDHVDAWAGANGPAITIDNGHTDDSGASPVPVTEQVKGVAVVASSSNHLSTIVASGTLGGTLGAAAAVSADFVDDAVNAYIGSTGLGGVLVNGPMPGAGIGADRQVRVVAANRTDIATFGGSGSLGSEVGVGGVISLVSYAKQTRARIENASSVFAESQVAADAYSFENEFSVLVGGDLNEGIGLAGSASIITAHNLTSAWINDATVLTPGDSRVHAQDDAGYRDIAGGFALSGELGVGAGLVLYELANETRAYIDGVDGTARQVDAGGLLEVSAASSSNIKDLAIAGGVAETVGLAGGFSIENVNPVTEAYLAPGVRVDQDPAYFSGAQDLLVAANDNLVVDSGAGAVGLAVEDVSLGAGINILVENTRVLSTLGAGVGVLVGGNIAVIATADKSVNAFAIGAGVNGDVSGSGAVSSVILGGGQQANAASTIAQLMQYFADGVDTLANDYLVNPLRDLLGLSQAGSAAVARTPNLSGLASNLKTGGAGTADSKTVAAVGAGASLYAGGNLSIIGEDRTDVVNNAGNGDAALGVAVGAAVAVTSAANDVQASLGTSTTAVTGGDIEIGAHYIGVATPSVDGWNVTSGAYGGGAGGIAGQASLGYTQVSPLIDAFAGPGALLEAGGNIGTETRYAFDQQSTTVGATLGGVTGTAADSRVYASPQSRARFEAGVSAQAGGTITIATHTSGTALAAPTGATVDGAGINYEHAEATANPLAHAYVLDGDVLSAAGAVEIASLGSFFAHSVAAGGAGGLAVDNDMSSTATGGAGFRAYVTGSTYGTSVTGTGVKVLAQDDATGGGLVVKAEIVGVSVGVAASAGSVAAIATDNSSMQAYVEGNATVAGTTAPVIIGSGSPVDVESHVTSISASLGDAGNDATSTATTNTSFASYVDGDVLSATTHVSGSSVDIYAGGRGTVKTIAEMTPSVSVGLLGADNYLNTTATGAAHMDAYVIDRALVEGDGAPGTPAVSILSGSDVVVDAEAMGGSGSLVLSDVDGAIDAFNNSIFNAYVSGGTTQTTTVQDRDSVSNDIVVSAVGDIDVKAQVPVAAAVSLVGSIGTLGAYATDNAVKNAYVGGNALVQTLGSSQGDGQVLITSDGGISVLSKSKAAAVRWCSRERISRRPRRIMRFTKPVSSALFLAAEQPASRPTTESS